MATAWVWLFHGRLVWPLADPRADGWPPPAYMAVYDLISIFFFFFTMLLAVNLIKDPVLDVMAFHISLA